MEQRYLLLHSLLEEQTYDTVDRNVSIQLINHGSSTEPDWEITHSYSLERPGRGLITYRPIRILSACKTLDVYLKTLQEMDVQQMANYLGLDSILNTSDSAKNAIASALMEQFHSALTTKYQILLFPDTVPKLMQSLPLLTVIPFSLSMKKS